MPKKITCVTAQLYYSLIDHGGEHTSLLALCVELGINYRHAWDCIRALERAGFVTVNRRARQPMVMATDPVRLEKFLNALIGCETYPPCGGAVFGNLQDREHRTQNQ